MNGWKRSVLTILVLLVLFGFSAVTVASAAKAVIVSDVKDLYYYTPRDNSFTHGSTLKVYTEMSNVNYEGFVFVGFVFIIEDPRGNVVSMDRVDVERRDYADDVYVVYSKEIPSWWLYGTYKLDIYAYNRLDKARINELERKVETSRPEELIDKDAFEDLEEFFESGSNADDLGVIKSFSNSIEEITSVQFFVRPEEEIEKEAPPEAKVIKGTKFTVTDVLIDKFTVKPGEPVSISVTVKNEGVRGTEKVTLVINGEVVAEELFTLDYLESKTLHFTVTKDLPGTYKVTIPGTDIVKLFFVEEDSEGAGNSTASPPVMQQSGEVRGGEKGLPIYIFCFGIAFIAIFVIIISHRFYSKQH